MVVLVFKIFVLFVENLISLRGEKRIIATELNIVLELFFDNPGVSNDDLFNLFFKAFHFVNVFHFLLVRFLDNCVHFDQFAFKAFNFQNKVKGLLIGEINFFDLGQDH